MVCSGTDDWLTVEQTADLLQVNPETIRRWIRTKRLGALSLGSRQGGYRVRRSDLDQFVTTHYEPAQRREREDR